MGRGGRPFLLCAAMMWLFGVVGPAVAGPLPLTMDETVARAIAASRDLRVSRKQVELAQANLDRSHALLPANPYVSGGAQYDSSRQQFTTDSGQTAFASNGPNYGFTLSQEFEIAGQRSKRIASAEQGVEKAVWDAKSAELTLVSTVKQTFVRALLGPDRIALARRGLDAAQSLSQSLEKKSVDTTEKQMDLNIAQVQEARAQRDLAQAEQGAEDAKDLLRYYLGLPGSQPIELNGAPITEIEELPPVDELIDRALQQRPDLVALRHSAEHAGLEVELKERARIPNVTISGNVSRFEGDTFAGGDLGMYLPLFQTGGPATREALAERDQARTQIDDLKRTIEWDVRQARRACEAAAVSLRLSKQRIMPKSDENLTLEQRRFRGDEVAVARSRRYSDRRDLCAS